MRVGYDARPIVYRWTGMRTYTLNLVRELLRIAPEFEAWLYFHKGEPDNALGKHPRLRWRAVRALTGWWWTFFQVPSVLRRDRVQLFHADYIVPPLAPCPTIVTMHDAISAMFIEPADLKTRLLTNALTLLSLHRSVGVLVPSESARRDVQRLFKVPARKIFVTPYGVSDMFRPVPKDLAKKRVAERFGIEGRFILTVNFFRPRKNAPVLAAAFRELKRRRVPVDRLVFVGAAPEPLRLTILSAAREHAKDVVFTGYLPDEWLPTFYSAAEVFAFPSRYEGFGLPVLEAMACGTPVVAGDAPAVNEIVKGVALLVPPNDWLALADAFEQVLTDEGLAEDLRRKGLTLAASFTWERTASLTWQVYRRFAESLT